MQSQMLKYYMSFELKIMNCGVLHITRVNTTSNCMDVILKSFLTLSIYMGNGLKDNQACHLRPSYIKKIPRSYMVPFHYYYY